MILSLRKREFVGEHPSTQIIISSIILAFTVIFYIYATGTFFAIDVYPLNNRLNNLESFNMSLVNNIADQIIILLATILWLAMSLVGKIRMIILPIYGLVSLSSIIIHQDLLLNVLFLISIPLMTSMLIIQKISTKKIIQSSFKLSLNYLAIFGIVAGIVSIVISMGGVMVPQSSSLGTQNLEKNDYAYGIFLLLSNICPFFILILIAYSPIRLLLLKFAKPIITGTTDNDTNPGRIHPRVKVLLVLLFMFLSVIVILIPHQPTINTNNGPIGADTADYVSATDELMKSSNLSEYIHGIFVHYFSGDRPVTLVFLTAIVKIMPLDLTYAVDHLPLILGPALVLVVYLLTRELTSNDTTAILGSFLTAISFHTLIGLYSGIYSNWFALIFGYLSLTFLIKFVKIPTKLNLAVFGTLVMLLLFSHVYTWTVLIIFMLVLLGVLYKLNYYPKKRIFILALVLTASVIVDVTRTEITGNPAGVERDISIAHEGGAGLQQLVLIWQNLGETVLNYSGGQYGNFPILALGIFWIFRCTSKNLVSVFLLVFLAIGFLPLLFGNTVLQSRVLYDIPLQIPASVALSYILTKHRGNLIVLSICIWIFAMSIKAVTNF